MTPTYDGNITIKKNTQLEMYACVCVYVRERERERWFGWGGHASPSICAK